MALLGAPAHELLRTHFNSSSVRELQALPVACKDVALRNPTRLTFPLSANSQHSRRCFVSRASSSSSASVSPTLQQVTFCRSVPSGSFIDSRIDAQVRGSLVLANGTVVFARTRACLFFLQELQTMLFIAQLADDSGNVQVMLQCITSMLRIWRVWCRWRLWMKLRVKLKRK